MVKERGQSFRRMLDLVRKSDISDIDFGDMKKFVCNDERNFTEAGKDLLARAKQACLLYKELIRTDVKTLVTNSNGGVLGADSFLDGFNKMYRENEKFRESLVVGLCRAYSCKLQGEVNPVYEVS